MLKNVVYDLKIFLLFYMILILMIGQCYAVLGLGNNYLKVEEPYVNRKGEEDVYMKRVSPTIGTEHNTIGLHWAEMMWTLRMSMGDNTGIKVFKKPGFKLTGEENYIFWVIWILTVVVTCVIFLNFIVAEASASYSKVVECLDEVIRQEMAALISEAEKMSLKKY